MPQNGSCRASVRVLILAGVAVAAMWLWALWPSPHDLVVTFLDVGQGDSILIQTPEGHTVLIDAGPANPRSGWDAGNTIVAPYLRRQGINVIDLLILTHDHEDHEGGMPAILKQFRVRDFAAPALIRCSKEYRDILGEVRREKIKRILLHGGIRVRFPDGVKLVFFYPTSSDLRRSADTEDPNNFSAVAKLEFGQADILLAGDAGGDAEAEMLMEKDDLRSDVLKVGHHGSSSATTPAFLRAVRPRIAIVSVGRRNAFGHPSRETLVRLRSIHAQTYRTDLDGAVTVETDGRKIWVWRSRKPPWLGGGK